MEAPVHTPVVLLLTDIENSSAHWEADPAAMSSHVARHDELIAAAVAGSGGRLVKHRGEGDSTFSVFESTRAAMVAAVAAQQAVDDLDFGVRMAIHAGAAEVRDGDYYGPTINRAGPLSDRSPGGEIVVRVLRCRSKRRRHLPASRSSISVRSRCAACTVLNSCTGCGTSERRRTARAVARPPLAPVLANEPELFVGRADLLTRMQRAWQPARAGARSLLLLAGEAGIGKTTCSGASRGAS